jgi:glycosyltransferase involved in cell wall biosynthesis
MRLSLIVISFNMRRELPRTIRTLSPSMQRGLGSADYEIIVVDNGSTEMFDVDECRRWVPEIAIHRMPDPSPSPVGAINRGLTLATGDLVGVFIDGARMASPRSAGDGASGREAPFKAGDRQSVISSWTDGADQEPSHAV